MQRNNNQSRMSYLRPIVCLLLLSCIVGQRVAIAEAKAASISNNWTLPQDGFSVFYRFFRDKISWFEADAVCQFHHGNLVTVNNGIQFDSTRAFLRELDVSDMVWIGLKGSPGSSSSSRFAWANSQPLDNNAGYWAESFPATEAPLCAAIDPSRSFRWHALNCNGPSTAAFLCELPVPDWGSHCTVTAMPSVTIQYLSDEAAIRLSRDCGDEEGERHVLCRAGESRATILSQLVCNDVASSSSSGASSSSYSYTEGGDSYVTSDETLYTTEDSSADPLTTTATRSSMDLAINKIVTEIQSIATNESLNGELEPLKPRKQPKKFNPLDEKKQKKLKKYPGGIKDKDQVEKSVTSFTSEPENTFTTGSTVFVTRSKRMRKEDLKPLDAGHQVKEERVRRETLDIQIATGTTAATEETPIEVTTTTNLIEEDTLLNYTGDPFVSTSSLDGNLEEFTNEAMNVTEGEGEEPSVSPIPPSNEPVLTTIQPEVNHEISGTPHSAQPKGAITHPMHISSDMTKEQLERAQPQSPPPPAQQPKDKILANQQQQDHFVPPMLLVKAKFQAKQPVNKQHIDAQENLTTFDAGNSTANSLDQQIQHTLESPMMETTNDISKFYPASTEKAATAMNEENKVLVDIPSEHGEEKKNSLVTPVEENVKTTTTVTVPSTITIPTSTESPLVTSSTTEKVEEATTTAADPVKEQHSEFSFSNIENYQPYRPNRRRSLTKPRSHSYLRKILG